MRTASIHGKGDRCRTLKAGKSICEMQGSTIRISRIFTGKTSEDAYPENSYLCQPRQITQRTQSANTEAAGEARCKAFLRQMFSVTQSISSFECDECGLSQNHSTDRPTKYVKKHEMNTLGSENKTKYHH